MVVVPCVEYISIWDVVERKQKGNPRNALFLPSPPSELYPSNQSQQAEPHLRLTCINILFRQLFPPLNNHHSAKHFISSQAKTPLIPSPKKKICHHPTPPRLALIPKVKHPTPFPVPVPPDHTTATANLPLNLTVDQESKLLRRAFIQRLPNHSRR